MIGRVISSLALTLYVFVALAYLYTHPSLAPLQAHAFAAPLGRLQDVQEPPEFPQGEFCEMDPNAAHPCSCRAMDSCDKPAEGQGQGPTENKECKQWCHKDHCHCPVKQCD